MVTLNTTPPQKNIIPQENNKNNIFYKPISSGGKAIAVKRDDTERSMNLRKGSIFIGISVILMVIYSVLFLYPQTKAYVQMPKTIADLQEKVKTYNDITIPNLNKEKNLHKSAYNQEFKEKEDALDNIFPTNIDKLGIIKRLENFATSIQQATPPFEFNSISFGDPIIPEGGGYTILPISTSIFSSRTNFDRFIQLVNLSGRLDSDIQIRLMEISNINIKYRGVDSKTGEDKGVDFSVKLNAYSR